MKESPIFLLHCDADEPLARWLRAVLERAGYQFCEDAELTEQIASARYHRVLMGLEANSDWPTELPCLQLLLVDMELPEPSQPSTGISSGKRRSRHQEDDLPPAEFSPIELKVLQLGIRPPPPGAELEAQAEEPPEPSQGRSKTRKLYRNTTAHLIEWAWEDLPEPQARARLLEAAIAAFGPPVVQVGKLSEDVETPFPTSRWWLHNLRPTPVLLPRSSQQVAAALATQFHGRHRHTFFLDAPFHSDLPYFLSTCAEQLSFLPSVCLVTASSEEHLLTEFLRIGAARLIGLEDGQTWSKEAGFKWIRSVTQNMLITMPMPPTAGSSHDFRNRMRLSGHSSDPKILFSTETPNRPSSTAQAEGGSELVRFTLPRWSRAEALDLCHALLETSERAVVAALVDCLELDPLAIRLIARIFPMTQLSLEAFLDQLAVRMGSEALPAEVELPLTRPLLTALELALAMIREQADPLELLEVLQVLLELPSAGSIPLPISKTQQEQVLPLLVSAGLLEAEAQGWWIHPHVLWAIQLLTSTVVTEGERAVPPINKACNRLTRLLDVLDEEYGVQAMHRKTRANHPAYSVYLHLFQRAAELGATSPRLIMLGRNLAEPWLNASRGYRNDDSARRLYLNLLCATESMINTLPERAEHVWRTTHADVLLQIAAALAGGGDSDDRTRARVLLEQADDEVQRLGSEPVLQIRILFEWTQLLRDAEHADALRGVWLRIERLLLEHEPTHADPVGNVTLAAAQYLTRSAEWDRALTLVRRRKWPIEDEWSWARKDLIRLHGILRVILGQFEAALHCYRSLRSKCDEERNEDRDENGDGSAILSLLQCLGYREDALEDSQNALRETPDEIIFSFTILGKWMSLSSLSLVDVPTSGWDPPHLLSELISVLPAEYRSILRLPLQQELGAPSSVEKPTSLQALHAYQVGSAVLARQLPPSLARSCFETALEIDAALMGESSFEAARDLLGLASAVVREGDAEEGLVLALEALRHFQDRCGPSHAVVAEVLRRISVLEHEAHRIPEALVHAQEALDLTQIWGDQHPIRAAYFRQVATLLQTRGRTREALPLYRQADQLEAAGTDFFLPFRLYIQMDRFHVSIEPADMLTRIAAFGPQPLLEKVVRSSQQPAATPDREPPFVRLSRLEVQGYRALRNVDLRLERLNVIIGPNGCGKTTLLDALRISGELIKDTPADVFKRREGLSDMFTRGLAQRIAFSTEMKLEASDTEGLRPSLIHTMAFELDKEGRPALEEEQLYQARGARRLVRTWLVRTEDHKRTFRGSQEQTLLPNPGIRPNQSQWRQSFKETEPLWQLLSNQVHYSAPRIDRESPLRLPQLLQPGVLYPSPSGDDLFSALKNLQDTAPEDFQQVTDFLSSAFPHFKKLEFPTALAGKVLLAWHDQRYPRPVYANELSDGTLRFLHLAALLLTPKPPPLILIDEPEDSLHPQLLYLLAQMLQRAAMHTQVVAATHAVELVRHLEPAHLVVVQQDAQGIHLQRGDDLDLKGWLENYTLDELWRIGELGGW